MSSKVPQPPPDNPGRPPASPPPPPRKHTTAQAVIDELREENERLRNEQSKQARKLGQMRQTVEQLHDRLARLQSSKRNKASQIARLKAELAERDKPCVWTYCKITGSYTTACGGRYDEEFTCDDFCPNCGHPIKETTDATE